MNPLWPTAPEAATLRFLVPMGTLRTRALAALMLFAVRPRRLRASRRSGSRRSASCLILCGHLPLWVRTQTTAPGGATPAHEELWAPVEDDWLKRVEDLEKRGARWDTTPWDISNGIGCLALLALLGALAAAAVRRGAGARPGRRAAPRRRGRCCCSCRCG